MDCQEVIFSGHAVIRMFERNIRTEEIRQVIASGEIIKQYLDDTPYASFLIMGWAKERPLHVVVALDKENERCYIVTCYVPDPSLWNTDFTIRR